MNTSAAPSRNRSNLWALKPRSTPTSTSGNNGSATFAASLPPGSACDYWVRRLDGCDIELSLPFCAARSRIENTAVITPTMEVPYELAERLRTFAQSELTSPFTLLLAAWEVVLARHSGQSEFMVGCGLPGGKASVLERPLLVHAIVRSGAGFRTLMREVGMRRAEGATHGNIPLSTLVAAFSELTTPGRHPLFQAAFVQRNSLTEASAHTADNKHCPPVDVACVWEDNGRSMRIRVEYPAGIIAPDIAARLPAHMINILRAAVSLPEAPVGTLPMLTAAEYMEKARS